MVPTKVMSVAKIIWTCKFLINPGCIWPSALGRVTALPATIIHPTPTKEMMTPTVPTTFRFKMCVFFKQMVRQRIFLGGQQKSHSPRVVRCNGWG